MLDLGAILFYIATFFGLFTTIFFLITIYENWGNQKTNVKKITFPKVCIIVPCFNEEKTLAKTLNSLLELDYPKKQLEIIVVDDGSKDNTFLEAKKFENKGITIYKKENGGKHTALNFALTKTTAEFVGALDADSTVAKDSLKKLITHFYKNGKDQTKTVAVTPSLIINNPKGILRRIQSIEFILGVFLRRVFADIGSQNVTPGPFTIYRKSFFDNYGNYRNAHMTEDIEVALRIITNNLVIENATDAYVYTHGPSNFKSLYKQRLRWYNGFVSNVADYKHLFSRKQGNLGLFILPSSFISVFLLSAILIYTLFISSKRFIINMINYGQINFDIMKLIDFKFDSFFINTGPLVILGAASFIISLAVILFAKKFAKEKNLFKSYVTFIVIYPWLYAFWWIAAWFCFITKKNVAWGHKSESEYEISK
jgi:cellulose synthase/poly-beta-1,6-N-acetylglucosamine synthase-like glycosyltransferase